MRRKPFKVTNRYKPLGSHHETFMCGWNKVFLLTSPSCHTSRKYVFFLVLFRYIQSETDKCPAIYMFKLTSFVPRQVSYHIYSVRIQLFTKHLTSTVSSSSNSTVTADEPGNCFGQWMELQKSDLFDLMQAISLQSSTEREENESSLNSRYSELIDRSIQHFAEYMKFRSRLAPRDTSPYFAPSWCSSLENSLMWIAGCWPSIYIRLTYAICGLEFESHLSKVLLETRTSQQISQIDALRSKTVFEEDRLATQLATLQEDASDHPLATMAIKCPDQMADMSSNISEAIETHEKHMVAVLEDANRLRMRTLKELLLVRSPKQGVDLLAAGKKLHLRLHQWGKIKDLERDRKNCLHNHPSGERSKSICNGYSFRQCKPLH